MARLFHDNNTDLSKSDAYGKTSIRLAVSNNNHADLNKSDKWPNIALILAILESNEDIVRLLIKQKADKRSYINMDNLL